jgi:hypothetical protein
VVFGAASSERSNLASFYNNVLGDALGQLPTGLIDFTPTTGRAWALLNCNYAEPGGQMAMLRLSLNPATYQTSLRQLPLPASGAIQETANGCFVEVDQTRTEPCFEMMGDDATIDVVMPALGSQSNGTLTYDIYRSFGYDGPDQ